MITSFKEIHSNPFVTRNKSSVPFRFDEPIDVDTTDSEPQILPSHKAISNGVDTFADHNGDNSLSRKDMTVTPLIRLQRPSNLRRVDIIQQFEGIVTEVGADFFVAQMHDLTNSSNSIEVMEFDLRELSKEDQAILQEGSVFYWTMGYETKSSGQVVRISEMRLQRNPIWSQSKLDAAQRNSNRLFTLSDE